MTYEEINAMIQETSLPFAYHHFAEGESPEPPFLIFLSGGESGFSADNIVYNAFKKLNIELYTNSKNPETEQIIENVLTQHNIFYTKTESWIESEKFFQILYETEV